MDVSSSPERHTFQDTKPDLAEMWAKIRADDKAKTEDPEWRKDNLEYDLRSTEWILTKVRTNKLYAQNLYAAMCNNEFIKLAVVPILKDQRWSCSWRHAGGIVADMRQEGDYINWYCSGIKGGGSYDDPGEAGHVSESTVTDEIREDLNKLGWAVVDERSD